METENISPEIEFQNDEVEEVDESSTEELSKIVSYIL